MRIVIVSEYARPWPGGISEHVHHEAEALIRLGHEVVVVTGPGASCAPFPMLPPQSGGTNMMRLPFALEFTGNGARSRLSFGASLARMGRVLKEVRADVMHVHAPLDPLLAPLAVLASRAPVVGTFHASFAPSRGWALLYRSPLARAAFRKLRRSIAVSGEAERSIARYFPAEYARVPNGVDVVRFSPRAPDQLPPQSGGTNIGPRAPALLFVGRPDPRKGLRVALHAFARVRRVFSSAQLRIVGAAPDAVLRESAGAPLEGVEALGYVEAEAMAREFRGADLLLAPSLGGESQGIVLLEAMACAVVPIASKIAGYAETVRDGDNGVLVLPGSPESLADAAIALLRDPAKRAALGRAARATAERYDWSLIGAQLASIFEEARRSR